MSKKTPSGTVTNYRNSKTGQFVPPSEVRRHPATTETERNPRHAPSSPPKKGR